MLRLPEQHGGAQQGNFRNVARGLADRISVCLIRAVHQQEPPQTSAIYSVILDLMFIRGNDRAEDEEDEENVAARLLDAQFYDDTQLVLVLQTLEEKCKTFPLIELSLTYARSTTIYFLA
jgi:hypothetical protein